MEPKAFYFSYLPLIYATSFDMNRIEEILDKATTAGTSKGLAWIEQDDGVLTACFVLEKAEELADHIKFWSEGEPSSWFNFKHKPIDGGYSAYLEPDVKKSVERINAKKILDGEFIHVSQIPKEMTVFFSPIYFGGPDKTYKKIKGKIRGKVRVDFLDVKDINTATGQVDISKFIEIGTFKV